MYRTVYLLYYLMSGVMVDLVAVIFKWSASAWWFWDFSDQTVGCVP